jgi:hypothetical protein
MRISSENRIFSTRPPVLFKYLATYSGGYVGLRGTIQRVKWPENKEATEAFFEYGGDGGRKE